MLCDEFLSKDFSDHKQFVIYQKLSFNCLSKNHLVKDCISEITCCHVSCGKKHHKSLHEEKTMPNSNSPANSNNVNKIQTAPQH